MSTPKPSSTSTDVDDETEDILLIDPDKTDESSSSAEMTCKKIHFMLKNKNKKQFKNC
jgi:hypothetical protein